MSDSFRDQRDDQDTAVAEETAPLADETAPTYEEAAEEAYVEEHEAGSGSFAARALSFLLILIAGAALALWGGPKLAPMLPDWAAPAARYLTPGGDQAMRDVAAIRSEMDALRGEVDGKLVGVDEKLATIPDAPDMEAVRAIAAETTAPVLSDLDTRLTGRIDGLSDQVAAADSQAIESELSALATKVDGLAAQLDSLTATVEEAALSGGSMSEEAVAAITANVGQIDGLRAELGSLAERTGALSQRIDEVEATADRRVQQAEARAQEQMAALQAEAEAEAAAAAAQAEAQAKAAADQIFADQLAALDLAARAGRPFEAQLSAISADGRIEIPQLLSDVAADGVASQDALTAEFRPLAHAAIRANIKAEAEEAGGTGNKLAAFLRSRMAVRSTAPQEGDSPDAVLSRIEAALTAGDLSTVMSEAETLPAGAAAPLQGWLEKVTARQGVLSALDALTSGS